MRNPTVETYNWIASAYSKSHFDPNFWSKEFSVFRKLIRGKKVIDIGCGAGRDAVLFCRNGFDYTGIDGSRKMLNIAKRRALRGKFLRMDFTKLGSLPYQSFDGFWAAASLLHVPKRTVGKTLKKVATLIKPDGVGFVSVKERRRGLPSEGLLKEQKYGGIHRYFAFYTKGKFGRILRENGYTIIQNHVKRERDREGTVWFCYFVKKR